MNRRDFLKVTAAGLAYATVMTNDLFAEVIREFGKISRAKVVIFVVGDVFYDKNGRPFHVGKVEWYDPSKRAGMFYGRQRSKAYSDYFGNKIPGVESPSKFEWTKYSFKIYRFKGFDQDQKRSSLSGLLNNFFNALIPSAYAEEVRNKVREGSRRIDPLVIDLDGDGIKLVNINKSNAMFDLTGSGFANKTGWISSGDAFLVG